jgi:hypothetical protein
MVEVVLAERERFLDAQAGAPQDDDHRAYAPAVTVVGCVAHDSHDLVDRRRVGRVAHPLVARQPAGVVAGQRRGRATPSCRVEHREVGHEDLLGSDSGYAAALHR